MRKRILASLLSLALILSLAPTVALAAGEGDDAPYSVTFQGPEDQTTEVGVYLVDGSSEISPSEEVLLNGETFSLAAEGAELTVLNLIAGYGLMEITSGEDTYLFQSATWGENGTAIDSISYSDVTSNRTSGLYLRYTRLENQTIDVTAVSQLQLGSEQNITSGTISAGAISKEKAEEVVREESGTYAYDHAELRNGSDAVTVTTIREIGGYYYALTDWSSTEVVFDAEEWSLYLVYSPGITITLNTSGADSDLTGNTVTIDGVRQTLGSGKTTFHIPENGGADIVITVGISHNLKVTKNSETLFDSAVNGYEIKTYTLSVQGTGGNQEYNLTWSYAHNDSNYTLDYSQYGSNLANYHGFVPKLDGTEVTKDQFTYIIRENSVLVVPAGLAEGYNYILNTLTINNTWIDIPWPGVDFDLTGSPNSTVDVDGKLTIIRDDAGEVQAQVTVSAYIVYGGAGNVGTGSCYEVTFTSIKNNLKINFLNLVGAGNDENRISAIGAGLTVEDSGYKDGDRVPGNVVESNHTITVTPEWPYYVYGFTVLTSDGNGNWEEKGTFTSDADTWYGEQTYPISGNNSSLISDKGLTLSEITSEVIRFAFRYFFNSSSSTNGTDTFVLAQSHEDYNGVPALSADKAPDAGEGQVFVGWSLYKNTSDQAEHAYYAPGQSIPWAAIDAVAESNIQYGDAGKAYICLYPVFVDEVGAPIMDYEVEIYKDGDKQGEITIYNGVVGSTLLLDNILELDDVQDYYEQSLVNCVLDRVKSDSEVTASREGTTFKIYYTLRTDITVTLNANGGTFAGGDDTITLTGLASSAVLSEQTGYEEPTREKHVFIGWSTDQDAESGQEGGDITVSESTTYYAVWADDVNGNGTPDDQDTKYQVTFQAGEHGTLSGKTSYDVLTGMSLSYYDYAVPTVTPETGHEFTGWLDSDGEPYTSNEILTLEITAHMTFTAQYKETGAGGEDTTYQVTVTVVDSEDNPIEGATVSLGNDRTGLTGEYGEYVFSSVLDGEYTVTASKDGYESKTESVTVAGANETVEITLNKTEPTVPETYTVTVENSYADVTGAGDYAEGDTVTINAGTRSNYTFTGWTVTSGETDLADSTSASTTFTMPGENVTVTANWRYTGGGGGGGGTTSYIIDASAGEGGSISPSGRVSVARGADRTFTITPDDGYEIVDVLVDDESVGAVSSYTFENVRANHTIEAIFAEIEETPGVANPDDTGVSDWLNTEDHIAYLVGYPGNLFGPDNNMTRAEAAQMFYNLLLNQDVAITVTFDDVPEDAWYAEAVNTLASLGMIVGVGDNQYAPERAITRAEFTTIAMRVTNGILDGENIFPDVSESDWYYDYVVGSIQYGWINGYPDGTFGPNNTITRAEVTAIVNRMLGRSADEDYVDSNQENLVQFTDMSTRHWAYYDIMEATNAHDYTKSSGVEDWTGLN